jgi:hypothetical protein
MDQNQNNHNLNISNNVSDIAPIRTLISPTDLIKSAVNFYKKNWKNLSIIGIVPQLFMSILSIVFGLVYGFDLINFDKSIILSVITSIFILLMFLIAVFINLVQFVVLVRYVHSHYTGTKLSLEDSFKQSFPLFWSIVFIAIVTGLINIGSMILFIAPGIFIVVSSIFYIFTFVIDGKRGFSSLIESYRLVRGHWWQIFGRILFFGFCVFVIYIALVIILIPLSVIGINSTLLSFFVAACIIPISYIYFYNIYTDLKHLTLIKEVSPNYKKWLVTFMIIGIIAILAIMAIIGAIGFVYQL